ncbi:unnamed protein product, partial [Rhizoctonia solani]
MCDEFQLKNDNTIHLKNDEKHSLDDDSVNSRNTSNSESNTEDANTGNNVHRPDSRVGKPEPHVLPVAEAEQPFQDGSYGSLSPSTSALTGQEPNGSLLLPGRYYIILEEEFDILPLIAAYASIGRKTLCCMPFVERSQSWRILLSAILINHEVLELTDQPSAFSPGVAQFMSSSKPSLLIQSFTSWQTHRTVGSISDSFLVWGFLNVGEEQLSRIQDTVQNTRHTCAIVTPEEYENFNFKTYFASLGFAEHPKSTLVKQFDVASLLSGFRTIVQRVLNDPEFNNNIHLLYKACSGFYMNPPTEIIWRSDTKAAQLAKRFAARILLHGLQEDGSSRFKPDGVVLPNDQGFDTLSQNRAVPLGLVEKDVFGPPGWRLRTYNSFNSVPPVHGTTLPQESAILRSTHLATNPAGRWYIVLQEDFDAIPFISYQVELDQKVVCFTSYGTSTKPHHKIFTRMTNYPVIQANNGKKNITARASAFNSLQSGLMLLPGTKDISALVTNLDTIIYWGFPPESIAEHLISLRATHVYILLSSDGPFFGGQNTTLHAHGIEYYPQSTQINSTGPGSPLHRYRDKAQQVMEILPTQVINKIYASSCKVRKQSKQDPRESVIRANRFAARVLLHGKPEDGSSLYPPIRPRPSLT